MRYRQYFGYQKYYGSSVVRIPLDSRRVFQCVVCGKKAKRWVVDRQNSIPVCGLDNCLWQAQEKILPERHLQRERYWRRKHPEHYLKPYLKPMLINPY